MSQVPLHAEAAGAGPKDAAEHTSPSGQGWRTPVGIVIIVATVIGLALRLLQLARPGHLLGVTEYDDGVYMGASIRLVGGVLPYRDFVLVQPPGVVVLMIPVAALGKLTGSAWALGLGRLLTACAGAASVLLAGLLVRHRGLLAVLIACGIMAVYPDAILAAHTVLQEPWLVLAVLAGLLAVFDGDRLTTSGRRLAWGGVAFGFAGAIKLWAIFPIVVIAVMCAPQARRLATYLGGALAGFLVPVLPFFFMDPGTFYRGVVLAQLVRGDDARIPLKTRLADLTGIVSSQSTTVHASAALAAAVLVLIVLVVGVAFAGASWLTHRPPPPLEWFVLITGVLVIFSFLWPADFYYHYAGYFAPFLALALALPVSRFVVALQPRVSGMTLDRVAAGVAGIALLAMFAVQVHSEAVVPGVRNPAAAADKVIPSGACVLTDQVAFTIVADRFTSSVPGCPQLVDSFGTDLELSKGRNGDTGAARTAAVRQFWANAFQRAQYVWLSSSPTKKDGSASRRIPWTPALRAYFTAHFQPIPGHSQIYRRVG